MLLFPLKGYIYIYNNTNNSILFGIYHTRLPCCSMIDRVLDLTSKHAPHTCLTGIRK